MEEEEDETEQFSTGSTIQEHIDNISTAAKEPKKSRDPHLKDLQPFVATVTQHGYKHGFAPDQLRQLISIVSRKQHLEQSILRELILHLYPVAHVASDNVVRVLGGLGHGQNKPSLAVQTLLLRWLIMVHHVLEEPQILSRAYGLLFNLLDTATIRPQLCHLLALVTRQRHIRLWRIQALIELSQYTGGDPAVSGLLKVFKEYHPDVIAGLDGKPSPFRHPNAEWHIRLGQIQTAYANRRTKASTTSGRGSSRPGENGFRVFRPSILTINNTSSSAGKAYGGTSLIPLSSSDRRGATGSTENTVPIEDITSAETLVNALEKISLPVQGIAVLTDPLLQKIALLRSTDPSSSSSSSSTSSLPFHHDAGSEIYSRATAWLLNLRDDIARGATDGDTIAAALEAMTSYVTAHRHTPEPIIAVVQAMLPSYSASGSSVAAALSLSPSSSLSAITSPRGREALLQILSRLPVPSAAVTAAGALEERLLVPLVRALEGYHELQGATTAVAAAAARCFVLCVRARLLRHWLTAATAIEGSSENTVPPTQPRPSADLRTAVVALTAAACTDALALLSPGSSSSTTADPETSEVAQHLAVVNYFRVLARLGLDSTTTIARLTHHHLPILIPPAAVVHRLFFSRSIVVAAGICDVLPYYKRAFEKVMHKSTAAHAAGSSQGQSQIPSSAVAAQRLTSSPTGGGGGGGGNTTMLSFFRSSVRGVMPGSSIAATTATVATSPAHYDRDYLNQFNAFLMDCCNCLWRGNAFNTTDTNAQGCLMSAAWLDALAAYISALGIGGGTRSRDLSGGWRNGRDERKRALKLEQLFSLSVHPSTALLAARVMREREHKEEEERLASARQDPDGDEIIDHANSDNGRGLAVRHSGPVTRESLNRLQKNGGVAWDWDEYRCAVLARMKEEGVGGMGEMLFSTLKKLKDMKKVRPMA